ncbi:hypothetical protein JCM11251_005394 [Rhodosporidiobolus azoricus]
MPNHRLRIKRNIVTRSQSQVPSSPRPPRVDLRLPTELRQAIYRLRPPATLAVTARAHKADLPYIRRLLLANVTFTFVPGRSCYGSWDGLARTSLSRDDQPCFEMLVKDNWGLASLRQPGELSKFVRTLTFRVCTPDTDAVTGDDHEASAVIMRLLGACSRVQELTFPDQMGMHFRRLVPVIPTLPSLAALTFPATMTSCDDFQLLTRGIAAHLSHLTLVTSAHGLAAFDLSSFSSLRRLDIRCTGNVWSPRQAGKYVQHLQLPDRCPSLLLLRWHISGNTWRRQSHLDERPIRQWTYPIIQDKRMTLCIQVSMPDWLLSMKMERDGVKEEEKYDWKPLQPIA